MACEDNQCTGTSGPQHPVYTTSVNPTNQIAGCTPTPAGGSCPTVEADKSTIAWQLQNSNDSCYVDTLVNENLAIGGADLNVYKLLGIHEQCKTVDVTGKGLPQTNGDAIGYPSFNAFDIYISEWHSLQTGTGVPASAYLGYDFGEIKTNDGARRVYGTEASVRKHITAIAIKQSNNPINRVTRARIERSADGKKWYGVSNVNLPDDDCLNTILFNDSVLMRYWRLRPIDFNGESDDYWGVQTLEMFHNYVATETYNIQDKIFMENRDRDYDKDSQTVKCHYDLLDTTTELSKFGIELPGQSMYCTVSFSSCIAILGRPLIIGDIVEVPSEAQYSSEMKKILKWMEVVDVAWSTEGYTPGWTPTLLRIIIQPAYASQETQDIFGDLAEEPLPDELGLVTNNVGTGNNPNFQDYSDASQTAVELAKEHTPQQGREMSSTIRAWEEDEIKNSMNQGVENLQKIGLNPTGLYAEDAMPPNNKPFTEGETYPENPTHGDYHRLLFEGYSKDVPARLYRYSEAKGRWIYLETDRRAEFDGNKPRLQEFLTAKGKTPHTNILRDDTQKCEDEE